MKYGVSFTKPMDEPDGAEFQVNNYTDNHQLVSSINVSSIEIGCFAVVWLSMTASFVVAK